ncbi:hypothetical protein AB4Y96_00215 [Phyllobacterium sp. TAF24]|uniref:hypothetical protein n=1 Tax=Phyllobacterium sp. TAF24 TaxID=3233068 RepID=UPI003F98E7F7
MTLHGEHSSRNLRLRWHISANELQLKALKIAPHSSLRSKQYRQLENERAMLEAELRFQAEIDLWRKYDPDQPREPAGTREGGRWIDGGGAGVGVTAAVTAHDDSQGRTSGTSWLDGAANAFGSAANALRPLVNKIPGAATLTEILNGVRWTDDIGGHIAEYNELVADVGNDSRLVPIISSRAQAYTKGKDDAKTWAAVAALSREEAAKYCPYFMRVQHMLNEATREAGPVSNYGSMTLRGTAIHSLLRDKVRSVGSPNLRAEISFLKSVSGSLSDRVYPSSPDASRWVKYGTKGSVRVDVYDRASEKLVCVYDAKTGESDITVPRLGEIGRTVARYFGEGTQFFVMGMKPFE